MTIKTGDTLPDATLRKLTSDGITSVKTSDLCANKTIALVCVPGAFTPTCSAEHVPGFIKKAQELKQSGVDEIVCISVNDPFVMAAWEKSLNSSGHITFLSDGNGEFVKALGAEMDGSGFGMGLRGRRFSAVVHNGKITVWNLEEGGAYTVSSADKLLEDMKKTL